MVSLEIAIFRIHSKFIILIFSFSFHIHLYVSIIHVCTFVQIQIHCISLYLLDMRYTLEKRKKK